MDIIRKKRFSIVLVIWMFVMALVEDGVFYWVLAGAMTVLFILDIWWDKRKTNRKAVKKDAGSSASQ